MKTDRDSRRPKPKKQARSYQGQDDSTVEKENVAYPSRWQTTTDRHEDRLATEQSQDRTESSSSNLTLVPSDHHVCACVRRELASFPTLRGSDIEVVVKHRTVTLYGNVASPAIKQESGMVAALVPGVAEVCNYLKPAGPD